MLHALQWINDNKNQIPMHEINNIHIISDSQNLIKIISQIQPPKDDIVIRTAKQIDDEMQRIEQQNY